MLAVNTFCTDVTGSEAICGQAVQQAVDRDSVAAFIVVFLCMTRTDGRQWQNDMFRYDATQRPAEPVSICRRRRRKPLIIILLVRGPRIGYFIQERTCAMWVVEQNYRISRTCTNKMARPRQCVHSSYRS